MAQFDAGSIVGSLHLDRDPFTEGLDLAKKQAQEFEDSKISKTVEVTERVRQEGDLENPESTRGGDETRHEKIEVDDAEAKAKLDEFALKSDRATRDRTEHVKVKSDDAVSNLDKVSKKLQGLPAGLGLIASAAIGLGPALVPVAAGVLGVAGALAGGLATAGLGLGAFGLVAKSEYTQVATNVSALADAQKRMESAQTTSQKAAAVLKLAAAQKVLAAESPAMQAASGALLHFKDTLKKLQSDTQGPVFGVMTQGLNLAATILPKLEPLVVATAHALSGAIGQLSGAFSGPGFSHFITFLSQNIGPIIGSLTTTLINFGKTFGNIIMAMEPLTLQVFGGLANFSAKMAAWSGGGGLQKFLDYVEKNGPAVMALFKNLLIVIGHLGEGMAATGPSTLSLVNTLLTLVAWLPPGALMAIAYGILAISTSLKILKVAGQLGEFAGTVGTATKYLKGLNDPQNYSHMGILAKNLKGLGSSATNLGKVGWGKIVSGVKSSGTAIATFGKALLTNPLTLYIAAILLLALAAYEIYKHWGAIAHFFKKLWDDVAGFFTRYHAIILQVMFPFIGIPIQIYQHWGQIVAFFKGLWEDTVGLFKKHWLLILEILFPMTMWPFIIYQHWHQIVGWLEGVWKDVWNGVKTGWNAIMGWLEGLPAWFGRIWEAIKNGVTQEWTLIIGWLKQIPGWVEGFFKALPGDMEHIGEAVIQGLWNGIKNIWGNLMSWVGGAVKSLPGKFMSAFGINSPSKLFHGIGFSVGEGFHNGLMQKWNTMSVWLDDASKKLTVNADLTKGINGLGANAGFVKTAANVATQQATALQLQASKLDKLTQAVSDLPGATDIGKAVSKHAGNVETAMSKQTKDLVTAGRTE